MPAMTLHSACFAGIRSGHDDDVCCHTSGRRSIPRRKECPAHSCSCPITGGSQAGYASSSSSSSQAPTPSSLTAAYAPRLWWLAACAAWRKTARKRCYLVERGWRSRSLEDGRCGRTTNGSAVPVAVSGVSDATQIAAGYDHTCALLTGGSIDCWGENNSGQLGDGTTNQK